MSEPGPKLKHVYRADIDGLRAVAVLLVVFYHLREGRTLGGFIGVDVFFVISGYLISSVILADMDAGRFSIVNFYERRIRRIFPALFVLLLVVSFWTSWYMGPAEIVAYAWSMLAALSSWSNILFLQQGGYFDAPAILKPLLHTWSLGVEEQFYIFFPLFLMAVRRWFPRRMKLALWTVTLVTFGLACLWVRRDASVAFYATPLRAWELLLGTLLSQRYLPAIRGVWQRNLASFSGIVMVLVPAMVYSDATKFPGLAALLPCAGAGLVIAAGENGNSMVGDTLARRPVVFLGLISYSLYLWHWPVIVFADTFHLFGEHDPSGRLPRVFMFVLSLVLGVLSWRFVETPFRTGPRRPGRRTLFYTAGVTAAFIAAVAGVMIATGGLRFLMPPVVIQYADAATLGKQQTLDAWRIGDCFLGGLDAKQLQPSTCLQQHPGRKHYLLLGDSHAAQLYPGLSAVFPRKDLSQITASYGCHLLLLSPGETDTEGSLRSVVPRAACRSLTATLYNGLLEKNHFDVVLLAGLWYDCDLVDLARTVAWFKQRGTEVVLFGPNVKYGVPLPTLLIWSVREPARQIIASSFMMDAVTLDRKIAAMARSTWNVRYISSFEDLCNLSPQASVDVTQAARACPLTVSTGVPLLFDTNHFTVPASIHFAQVIRDKGQIPWANAP